jgi:anaphase-promoting complex subunit 2
MIKDIENSKGTVTISIHSMIQANEGNEGVVVDAAIVSHTFWPALQKEPLKHHFRIQSELDQFSEEYSKLNNPRRLLSLNQLGNVDSELDILEDGTVVTRTFSCSPLLATLISHFADKESWTAQDLSNKTGIPERVAQKKMVFWVHNRVVKFATAQDGEACYELPTMEAWQEADRAAAAMHDEDGHDGLAVSQGAHEEEEVQVYESFITVTMLTNRQLLPLDSIHTMLQMMVTSGSDHKYNKTPEQLTVFLQQLCEQEKIECGPEGMYKLVKKDK